MSICATLWTLKFPREGNATLGCDWITVHAQAGQSARFQERLTAFRARYARRSAMMRRIENL
ncbi:MAG TPA: hypothetical protein PK640_05540 [Verrucomicrobiota bacterium]|nr:hypothetical protein [Verrucomicrobiota bacterium]